MTNNDEIIFERNTELNELLDSINTPEVKVVVGLRRAGKSYLLNELFYNELIKRGYSSESILMMNLSAEFDYVRSPVLLKETLVNQVNDDTKFIFIDEIQLAGDGYADTLISFAKNHKNIDIYVTGSNSKVLSDDIRKAFKENRKVITLRPLSYSSIKKAMPDYSVGDYFKYGSLPIVLKKPKNERLSFLKELYEDVYLSDIRDRFRTSNISNQEKTNIIIDILSNMMTPISEKRIIKGILGKHKISEEEKIKLKTDILDFINAASSSFFLIDFNNGKIYNDKTPSDYIDHDIKKYCFDVGILNVVSEAIIDKKNSSILENIIFLELLSKDIKCEGCYIDKPDGSKGCIDFYFEKGEMKYYIQVAFTLTEDNRDREIGNLDYTPTNSSRVTIYMNNNLIDPIPETTSALNLEDFLINF